MKTTSRRQFLGGSFAAMGCTAVGAAIAQRTGFAAWLGVLPDERLRFGALDPLVDLLQATNADELMPLLVAKLKEGLALSDLAGAISLANARAFGGTHYDGYHCLMATMPSFEMGAQMPGKLAALPLLKVIHRTARTLANAGKTSEDALAPIEAAGAGPDLAAAAKAHELARAEGRLAQLVASSREQAYAALQSVVREDADVHRVVLSWRAYDLLRLTGNDNALTMLRMPLRFCIEADTQSQKRGRGAPEIQSAVPAMMKSYELDERTRGKRAAEDAWIETTARAIVGATPTAGAELAAAALKEGFDPEDVGRAISLAATLLLLHDPGRTKEEAGKPIGSVHGASVGVHASDSANAWRHIARVGDDRLGFQTLIAGACHTAGQGRWVKEAALDAAAAPVEEREPDALLRRIDGCVRERDQVGAAAAARHYATLGHAPEPFFARMLEALVEEDGALHAEKYFRTAQEEHASARPAHRAHYAAALARIAASGYGFAAPGVSNARALLLA